MVLLRMLGLIFVSVISLKRFASASQNVPKSWSKVCSENLSVSSSSESVRLPDLVDLQCSIKRSDTIQWGLNDLRSWTIDEGINQDTTPQNRTVLYNVTVECETGANISLPWPMRVAGLRELHVSYCNLMDKYKNFMDGIDSTIGDDMTVLEIRHSIWVNNDIGDILQNLTSDFDCGQDSSLVVMITSNTTDVSLDDTENVSYTKDSMKPGLDEETKVVSPANDLILSGPAKPEDQLIKDIAKVVSDQKNVGAEESNNKIAKETQEPEKDATGSSNIIAAEQAYIDIIKNIYGKNLGCKFEKLKVMDGSISLVTPRHFFELLVYGAEYPVLENMNYSFIGLEEIPQEILEWPVHFPKLNKIDLSHNYVTKIVIPPHPRTPDVVMFDLSFNNITEINFEIINSWAAFDDIFVDIRNNPIHCGCEMVLFLKYLTKDSYFEGNLARYNYVRNLTCQTPEPLRGHQLISLTEDSLQCPVYTSDRVVVITLAVVLGILIIIVIIIIKYKVEIRILLFTRLKIRLPCDSDIERNNKTYDAFVSYSNEDAIWVHENLVIFLENPANGNPYIVKNSSNHSHSTPASNGHNSFRLCIHERDFTAGRAIFDNIIDCIQASRHTIIVLSPSFIKSQWSMEELRQAYRQSLVEKTRHLIIILLEKVSKDELDPLIRRCCKTFTYLDANDSLFKDRLVYSLSTKSRRAREKDGTSQKECKDSKRSAQAEPNVYDMVESAKTYDNVAYFNNINISRPQIPHRELSNMSISSTAVLTSR